MCTAVSFLNGDHYFGRNLDLDFHYSEEVSICPRCYPLKFSNGTELRQHYALIGVSTNVEDYPLYYDACNEKGLAMAGLNFPGNAVYFVPDEAKVNVATFEFILWCLSQFSSVSEVRQACQTLNLTNQGFSEAFPPAPLHWMISDCKESIVIESVSDGLKVYENPCGVMTNNPPFPLQLFNLNHYRHLSTEIGENHFSPQLDLEEYSKGMGGLGLPGDLSSMSRFIRASFVRLNSRVEETESANVHQFFKILGSVEHPKGLCRAGEEYEYTIYSSCMNTAKGIYYYTTYENSQLTAVYLHREDLDCEQLITYPLITEAKVLEQN